MDKIWTKRWREVFVWLSAYLGIVAFAIVGGYVIAKSEDKELRKKTKFIFIITLIFAAISAFIGMFNSFGNLFDGYLGSNAYNFCRVLESLVFIARTVVYAVFIICAFVKNKQEVEKQEELEEEQRLNNIVSGNKEQE